MIEVYCLQKNFDNDFTIEKLCTFNEEKDAEHFFLSLLSLCDKYKLNVSVVHQAVKDFDKYYKVEGYKQTDTDTFVVSIADSFIFGFITDSINI